MDERLQFVSRLPDGEKMAQLCRGVRHLTQDRLINRYNDSGWRG